MQHKKLSLTLRTIITFVLTVMVGSLLPSSVSAASQSSSSSDSSYYAQKDDTTKTAGPRVFVSPHWVKQVIDGKTNVKNYKIVEASYGNDSTFKKGHIPGAIHFNTNLIESEANQWNILSAKQVRKVLLKRGITKDTTLIVYSSDINAASRVAFAAFWDGVDNIKIVDGGYSGWKKSNYKVTKGKAKTPKKAMDFGTNVPANAKYEIKTPADFKKQQKQDPNVILASTRSWKEFIGKTSGYSYIKDKGEPKGAVYAKTSKTSADSAYLLNKDGTVKDASQVLPEWQKWGITPESNIDFYCGTGWRASTAFFIAYQAGWKNIHIYDGGWYAWDKAHQKNASQYPVQVGNPHSDNVKILK